MKKEDILNIVNQWKEKHKKKLYTPYKYFVGLPSKRSIIKKIRRNGSVKNEQES